LPPGAGAGTKTDRPEARGLELGGLGESLFRGVSARGAHRRCAVTGKRARRTRGPDGCMNPDARARKHKSRGVRNGLWLVSAGWGFRPRGRAMTISWWKIDGVLG